MAVQNLPVSSTKSYLQSHHDRSWNLTCLIKVDTLYFTEGDQKPGFITTSAILLHLHTGNRTTKVHGCPRRVRLEIKPLTSHFASWQPTNSTVSLRSYVKHLTFVNTPNVTMLMMNLVRVRRFLWKSNHISDMSRVGRPVKPNFLSTRWCKDPLI